MSDTPKPGSSDARANGCTCPIEDNKRGAGNSWDIAGATYYWIEVGCPVHDNSSGRALPGGGEPTP